MPQYVVVVVEPEFEETVGLVARAMKNFGLSDLYLVNPRVRVGLRARTRAGHAQEILDGVRPFPSLQKAVENADLSAGTSALRARSSYRILRRPSTPREFATSIGASRGTVAIVFGREGTGLKNEELNECDMVITIPASEEYPTLNISHAAATIFYELYSSTRDVTEEAIADAKVKTALLKFLEIAANSSGLSGKEVGLAARALRNVMGRSAIRAREASSLTGAFRAMAKRLEDNSVLPSQKAKSFEAVSPDIPSWLA